MKKSLVVLLIAVLVAGYAFADPTYSGEVTAKAAYSFDDPSFTYATADTLEATFTFAEKLSRNAIGTAYPYINVAGSVALTASLEGQSIKQELDIDTFEVVGEGWKLNLIAKSGDFDLAKSAIDTLYVKTKQYAAPVATPYTIAWGTKDNAGISYTNDNFGTIFVTGSWTAGAELGEIAAAVADKAVYDENGKQTGWKPGKDTSKWTKLEETKAAVDKTESWVKKAKYNPVIHEVVTSTTDGEWIKVKSNQQAYDYYANKPEDASLSSQIEVATKDFAITDALSAKFAGGFEYEDGKYSFGASASFTYDDVAAIATDYDFKNGFDVAGSLKVGVFTFDGYFATEVSSPVVDDTIWTYNIDEDPILGVEFTSGTDKMFGCPNYLSFRAVAEIEEIGTTFTATAKNCLNPINGLYSVIAENTYIPGYTFTAGVKNFGVGGKGLVVLGAKAEYENGLKLSASAEAPAFIPVISKASVGIAYDSEEFDLEFNGLMLGFAEAFQATLESTFHADKFDVIGKAYYNTKADEDAGVTKEYWKTQNGLFVEAGIETDKLVDGAKFNLTYKSGELRAKKLGAVEAGLTVKF